MTTKNDELAMLGANLPEHLAERLQVRFDCATNLAGGFVLYWMNHAIRAHENPALDVAILTAEQLKLPVLVYQELSEGSRFANDRHHTFILQGAREVHLELAKKGICSAVHLERRGHTGSYLQRLFQSAALVVTEDVPTAPVRDGLAKLSQGGATPVWVVDTACVVPMQLVGKAYDRAFAFRDATRELLEKRLTRPWPEQHALPVQFVVADLSIETVDLATADLRALIAECDIDHMVGPVPHTLGGSSWGYDRWEAFKAKGLKNYAAERNDALRDGVSRMSAYLHYGMVSPMRIAREAAAMRGPGAEKYLDELLVWRELAYVFCHYKPNHENISAIPKWAIETLKQHENDTRPALLDWESLARGQTGDILWDAAQKSLLMQGELHNNVRMTWGKALLKWTPTAADALRRMIDLNHRYALDGSDPASYGGLLWCLGQFDRPHTPASSIFGTVRTRPTEDHVHRLDPDLYLARTTRPWRGVRCKVAVIGAGLSGLVCARVLSDHGFAVTVFDKSRGVGGRLATRQVDSALSFDHGAQFFTARDANFSRFVSAWKENGVVAEWGGLVVNLQGGQATVCTGQARYVGVPGMSAVAKHLLAADISVNQPCRISRVCQDGAGWNLTDESGGNFAGFDFSVVAIPAPQVTELLAPHPFAATAAGIAMAPCWALLVAFESRLPVPWDAAFVADSLLAWVSRNSSKPGRPAGPDCWVLHASSDWSNAHLEETPEAICSQMLDAFAKATQMRLPPVTNLQAHRWKFSQGADLADRRALFDPTVGLVVCGDWLGDGRVEGAFLSGAAAAGYVLRQVGIAESMVVADE